MSRFAPYYELVKPGIIYGNAVTAAVGFVLAAKGASRLFPLLVALLGLSLVVAAGCIANNYLDRNIDARMARTRRRLFVESGARTVPFLLAAAVMALAGLALLAALSLLAALAAFVGLVVYVGLYTPAKRRTPYATHVGAIAGAMPPLVGYFAGGGGLDLVALALFLLLLIWQLPHFFAIAIYRGADYGAAGIPVLPLTGGLRRTKIEITCYTAAFALAVALPYAFGAASLAYLSIAEALALAWLAVAVRGFSATDNEEWARHAFFFSLVVLLGSFGALALGALFGA